MSIYRENQQSSINLTTPKVAIIERISPPVVRAASTNVAGLVCQATRGDLDVIHTVGDISEFSRKLGNYLDGLDGYLWAKRYFERNGGLLKVVRVASGAVAASLNASGSISTSASGTVFVLTADSVGTWGNEISVQVGVNPNASYFDLDIRRGKEIMSYKRASSLYTDSAYIANLINQDANRFVDITMVKTDGSVPLSGTYSLAGGLNGVSASATGTALLDTAYVGTDDSNGRFGIQKFIEDQEVMYVCSARETTTINAALVTHIQSLAVTARRTIYSLPATTTVDAAVSHAQSKDDDKFKIIYPLVTVRNPFTLVKENISATPYAVAFCTSADYNISMSQQQVANEIIDLERNLTMSEIDSLTKNGVNPIYNKVGRGVIFGSDYTMSKNSSLVQDTVRRAKDFFGITFDAFLQPFISKPITPKLWRQMKNALDTFLLGEWKADRIGLSSGAKPFVVVIDSTNNPPSVIALNRVIIDAGISLLGNADIITLFMNASQENTFIS